MVMFQTTDEQLIHLAAIITEMLNVGVDKKIIVEGSKLAQTDQGVFELMELWSEADSEHDRKETLLDLEDIINEALAGPLTSS